MKKPFVIHPFLFAIFPVLFLFVHNIDQFQVSIIIGPTVVIIFLALVFWSLLSFVLRDRQRAGLIVSLFFLLFFSYGICYLEIRALMTALLGRYTIGTLGHVLLVWSILFALGTYAFVKTRRSLRNLTIIANIVASSLVLISLVNLGAYGLRKMPGWQDIGATGSLETTPEELEVAGTLPNIYYIVLDGYAGADILEEIYHYDNSDLLDYLTSKGFYITHKSRSNYGQTLLSLASSLNLTYLDGLVDQIGVEYRGPGPSTNMIRNGAVFRFLNRYDYEIVAFASGYPGTEIRNADTYLAARWYPDEFQVALVNMTPVPFVANALYDMHDWHRERILYTFDHVADLSELEGPIFVFAHIMAPHPPFVFGEHGEEIDHEYQFSLSDGSNLIGKRGFTRDDYVDRYREQLMFINSRLEEVVDAILSKSSRPTIVILQGDHGPGSMLDWDDPDNTYFKERLSILNAYYLPNNGDVDLYGGITPVNTFRVIFNHYFGTDYELLEDESYFSTSTRPYAFINVTHDMNADTRIEALD